MRLGCLAFVSTALVSLAVPTMAQMDGAHLDEAEGIDWVQEVAFSLAGYDADAASTDVMPSVTLAADTTLEPVAQTSFTIFFDWDSAALTAEANQVLDDVVTVATGTGAASLILGGYADLAGAQGYNLGLAERRANAAADGLMIRGVAPEEIVIRSFGGESREVLSAEPSSEPQQRRIEIFLS